jgi:hypothetical protein
MKKLEGKPASINEMADSLKEFAKMRENEQKISNKIK